MRLNNLYENIIRERFQLPQLKIEWLRSSSHYERALQMVDELDWDALEELLRKIQVITTRTDMRHTKEAAK
jgi:hypothetical protein